MGKADNTPWSLGCKIKCCKDCVAPKRHAGCHDTCPEYQREKKEHVAKELKRREEKKKDGTGNKRIGL